MAKKDNIKLLGKRVGYWSDEFKDDEGYVILPSRFFTGLVVAVVVPMEGYEAMAGNDVLLLQDAAMMNLILFQVNMILIC